jgi:hypothetical protein
LGEYKSRSQQDKQDRHETRCEDYPIEQNCGVTCWKRAAHLVGAADSSRF